MRKIASKIVSKMLELMYPPKCPLCGKILLQNNERTCEKCEKLVERIGDSFCLKCGKKLNDGTSEFCTDCKKRKHNFLLNRGLFVYNKQMKGCIYRYKYQNQRYYANYFAEEIVEKYGDLIHEWDVQAMIPVPLHKSRMKTRGFNQAEQVLRAMEPKLGIPLYRNYVLREKKTLPQKYLSEKGRQKNLKNAFKIAQNGVKLDKVLVCDDIYTTGSTLDAMSEVLHAAGVKEVYSICICIGEGK